MRRLTMPRRRRWTAVIVVTVLALAGVFALVGLWRQHSGGSSSGASGGAYSTHAPASSTCSLAAGAAEGGGQFGAAAPSAAPSASALTKSMAAPQPGGKSSTVNFNTAVLPSDHGRYLVRNGQLSLELARGTLANTVHMVTVLTDAYGGYVLSSAVGELPPGQSPYPVPLATQASGAQTSVQGMPAVVAGNGGTPYAWITVRIPANRFDEAVNRFERFGKVQELTTSTEDVTGQVVDLQARLGHYQAVLARLLTFLDKATTVGSALAVQDRIDQTQLTVEELTGELKQLRETVTFSTLNLSLVEKPAKHAAHASTGFWGSIGHSAWLIGQGAKSTVFALGIALPFIALVAAALAAILFGGRAARRRRSTHAGGSAPQGPAGGQRGHLSGASGYGSRRAGRRPWAAGPPFVCPTRQRPIRAWPPAPAFAPPPSPPLVHPPGRVGSPLPWCARPWGRALARTAVAPTSVALAHLYWHALPANLAHVCRSTPTRYLSADSPTPEVLP